MSSDRGDRYCFYLLLQVHKARACEKNLESQTLYTDVEFLPSVQC